MTNKLASKLKNLGQHAERLRRAVEQAPGKAAQLREAVVLTASQLQQVRAEVQAGITDLRADTGDHLLASLSEIEAGRDILRQAGFTLDGVDLELGATATQRLLLRLTKVESVSMLTLKRLHTVHQDRPALRGVLAAILRASDLTDHVDLPGLSYRQLTVVVGPIPIVRVGWSSELPAEEEVENKDESDATAATSAQEPPRLPSSPASVFSTEPTPYEPASTTSSPVPSSLRDALRAPTQFFAPSVPTPAPTPPPPDPIPLPLPAPSPTAPFPPAIPLTESRPSLTRTTTASALSRDWRKNALDRFKKMPDLNPPG